MERGKPSRHALERCPHLDHLDDLTPGLTHDEDAPPRERAHEALLFEDRECFADRRAADTECLHQLALIEAQRLALAVDVGASDGLLEERVGLIAQAHRVERGECQLPRGDADALFWGGAHSVSIILSPGSAVTPVGPPAHRIHLSGDAPIYQIYHIFAEGSFPISVQTPATTGRKKQNSAGSIQRLPCRNRNFRDLTRRRYITYVRPSITWV